jgi:cytochrome b6
MALFLFLVQIVTGILLSLYYKPSPDQAFESVRAIVTEIDFGWLIRSAHSWSANLLIGVLLLHLLTTYMMRSYRRPREMTWLTGVILLGLFMAFGFSGYLLPWNELAFFATRVGTAIVGRIPLIGEQLLLVARGGEDVTGDTLARFYALHVVVLPLLTIGLLSVHLFLVQKHGMSVPDGEAARIGGIDRIPSIPFVPDFLLRDMVGWYLALALLAALAALFPWELGEKADPFASAPEGIKPEWYFLFMFQALKLLPAHLGPFEGEVVGVLVCGLGGLAVLLVPFLDRGPRTRRTLNLLATLIVAFFIAMTAWGWFSDETEAGLRIILGTLLTLIVLALPLPFTDPGTAPRRALYTALALGALMFLGATARELL